MYPQIAQINADERDPQLMGLFAELGPTYAWIQAFCFSLIYRKSEQSADGIMPPGINRLAYSSNSG
ncbi:MAG: hypothetical protein HQK59_06435 [Deltaproteobacteria bacterium]|nr:hypothetical protein [Deltaproteobacteria bacterium]